MKLHSQIGTCSAATPPKANPQSTARKDHVFCVLLELPIAAVRLKKATALAASCKCKAPLGPLLGHHCDAVGSDDLQSCTSHLGFHYQDRPLDMNWVCIGPNWNRGSSASRQNDRWFRDADTVKLIPHHSTTQRKPASSTNLTNTHIPDLSRINATRYSV